MILSIEALLWLNDNELPELLKWVFARHKTLGDEKPDSLVIPRDREKWREVRFSRNYKILVYAHPNPDADPRTVVVWPLEYKLAIFPDRDTAMAAITHMQEA